MHIIKLTATMINIGLITNDEDRTGGLFLFNSATLFCIRAF